MKRTVCSSLLLSTLLYLIPFTALAAPSSDEIRHRSTIVRIARENRIDPALLMAVVKVESNFDAHARNPDGPVGLTQITPVTARTIQPDAAPSHLIHPENNLRLGARHLRQLLDEFKDPRMALAAYQAGTGRVKTTGRSILQHPHTGNHVAKVMREYEQYRRQPALQTEVGADGSDKRSARKGGTVAAGRASGPVKSTGKASHAVKGARGARAIKAGAAGKAGIRAKQPVARQR